MQGGHHCAQTPLLRSPVLDYMHFKAVHVTMHLGSSGQCVSHAHTDGRRECIECTPACISKAYVHPPFSFSPFFCSHLLRLLLPQNTVGGGLRWKSFWLTERSLYRAYYSYCVYRLNLYSPYSYWNVLSIWSILLYLDSQQLRISSINYEVSTLCNKIQLIVR